jgi:membrane-anchored glycerophosphoryl diester phosphodiesterase (GDPDase)
LLATIAVYGVFLVAAYAGHPILYLVYGVNPFDPQAFARTTSARPTIAFVLSGLTLVFYVIASLISARFTFVFPAIALDVPDASLRQSFGATRRSTWRLFFVFFFIFVIAAAIFAIAIFTTAIAYIASHPGLALAPKATTETIMFSTPFLVIYVATFIAAMMLVAVTAAAAARAYEIRINRGMTGVVEVFS